MRKTLDRDLEIVKKKSGAARTKNAATRRRPRLFRGPFTDLLQRDIR